MFWIDRLFDWSIENDYERLILFYVEIKIKHTSKDVRQIFVGNFSFVLVTILIWAGVVDSRLYFMSSFSW